MQKTLAFSPTLPRLYGQQEIQAVQKAMEGGRLSVVFGRETMKFEMDFSRFTGSRYAVATSSGTSALELALHGLGIGYGDEVIVPSYTFAASAVAVMRNLALVRFADIDPLTWNISLETIKPLVNSRTRAILVVHMFGSPADIEPIAAFARERGIHVIEDCAQAAGAAVNGKQVGSFGDVGCFSFNEIKNMTTGEGGMMVSDNAAVCDRGRLLRLHGTQNGLVSEMAGKCTMTEMEAAIGRVQLAKLKEMNARRSLFGTTLAEGLAQFAGIQPQGVPAGGDHVYSRFVFRVLPGPFGMDRDQLKAYLEEKGFALSPVYPVPIYKHPLFQQMAKGEALPGLSESYLKIYKNEPVLKEYLEMHHPNTEAFCKEQIGFIVPDYVALESADELLRSLEMAKGVMN